MNHGGELMPLNSVTKAEADFEGRWGMLSQLCELQMAADIGQADIPRFQFKRSGLVIACSGTAQPLPACATVP